MNALKALVIGMGLLIVIGIGLVGYGLSRGKPHAQLPGQPPMQQVTIEAREPFRAKVPVPAGWKLEQVTATGNRLVLRFSTPDGDRLTLLDAETGLPAGTVTLVPDTH